MKQFIYEFVGGKLNGARMEREEVEAIATGHHWDASKERAAGRLVHGPDLDNQPKVDGYVGPMRDGERVMGTDGKWHYTFDRFTAAIPEQRAVVIRYETREVYNTLSN